MMMPTTRQFLIGLLVIPMAGFFAATAGGADNPDADAYRAIRKLGCFAD